MYGWRRRIGLLIPSRNSTFRTVEIIEALEKNTGKPVVTSNQATLAMALRTMGIREKIRGFGALLEGQSVPTPGHSAGHFGQAIFRSEPRTSARPS